MIGGYTINEDTSKLFSALLVGVFEKGKLHYTGKVGTGFNEKIQQEIMQAFGPLEQKEIPFDEVPDVNKAIEVQAQSAPCNSGVAETTTGMRGGVCRNNQRWRDAPSIV